jgi:ubiquitin-conjugating enzyme E2 variant
MITTLSLVLQVLIIVALADFLAGAVHWAEDAYGSENTPVLGPLVIRPNIIHHHFPRFFTKYTWWQSSWELLVIGAVVLVGATALGCLGWQVWLFVAISVNANQVHKWAHRTRAENGPLISRLQDWHILQTPRHHGLHHSDPKNTYYCPITNIVNPVLERLQFWARLETLIYALTGVGHRHDTAVRGQGPGPLWLEDYRPQPTKPAVTSLPINTERPAMTAAVRARVVAFDPAAKAPGCGRCGSCAGKCPRAARGAARWEDERKAA